MACIIKMNYCGTDLKCRAVEGACTDMNIDVQYANFKHSCSESVCKNVVVTTVATLPITDGMLISLL